MNIPGELAKETIFQQIFQCPTDKTTNQMREAVRQYITGVLNDKQNKRDLVFYKGHIHESPELGQLILTLHLFAKEDNTQEKIKTVTKYHLKFLADKGLTLKSSVILDHTLSAKRSPFNHREDDEKLEPGWKNLPGDNCLLKFLHWWLIVPRAQWDLCDLLYQMYTFDMTHQGFLIKFVHFFTIPFNIVLTMCFLAQFNFPGLVDNMGYGALQVNSSLILLLLVSSLYIFTGIIRKCWLWGVGTAFVLFISWLSGNLLYAVYKVPGNPWYNPTTLPTNPIIWTYVMSLIQATSHIGAPQLPPYITGIQHWESLHEFFYRKYSTTRANIVSWIFIILAVLCFPSFSVAVSWFSWPHLIGTEVIYLMAGIGYQRESLKKFFRVAEKAAMSGDPCMGDFPTKVGNLTQGSRTQDPKDVEQYHQDKTHIEDLEANRKLNIEELRSNGEAQCFIEKSHIGNIKVNGLSSLEDTHTDLVKYTNILNTSVATQDDLEKKRCIVKSGNLLYVVVK